MTASSSASASGGSAAASDSHPTEVVLQLTMGYMASAALYAATKLGIPDILKSGARPAGEIAKACDANEDAVYRVMRALASMGVFTESAPRTFANTPASEQLITDRADSLRPMVLWLDDKFHFDTYPELPYAMKTGQTVVEKVFGESCFGYFQKNPEESKVFNEAMTGFSRMFLPAVLDAYDFSWLNGKTLVDVGGGHGYLLTTILKKYPQIHGVVYDLDHVVAGAAEYIHAAGVGGRCAPSGGDFFASVPASDAYILKHIIHDWDDEKATTILRNCARAGTGKTRVILIESVVKAGNEPHFAKWLDLEMLLLPGGRERTEADFAKLLQGAGFKLSRIVATQSSMCVIEAEKI
ncbi:MAG TPA: methyltransferase [Candidatus Sulfotelmatobacter sp.]|nr:methyltransferase [Candidatus Sulfotelmatobacter sp.]